MIIYYIGELGEMAIECDFESIQFIDGECRFSFGGEECAIKVENLIEIVAEV